MTIFFSKTLIIASLLLISSCIKDRKNSGSVNAKFEEEFSKEVVKLRAYQANQSKSNPSFAKTRPINQRNSSRNLAPRPQPNQKAQSFSGARFPADIFEIHYNLNQHPPFKVSGIEFDAITVPKKDAYGISSNLNDKQYLVAGNDSLQRSLDKYAKSRTQEDLEFSKILIKEQTQINQQKKLASLYKHDEISNKEKPKKIIDDEKWQKEIRAKRNDPIRKIIASQIVAHNLHQNQPKTNQKNHNAQSIRGRKQQ